MEVGDWAEVGSGPHAGSIGYITGLKKKDDGRTVVKIKKSEGQGPPIQVDIDDLK